jgi:hypothetical protein
MRVVLYAAVGEVFTISLSHRERCGRIEGERGRGRRRGTGGEEGERRKHTHVNRYPVAFHTSFATVCTRCLSETASASVVEDADTG